MKIRLWGTLEETAKAVELLRQVVQVRTVSGPYADRGDSILHRVYLDVDLP